jgi:hypothetical protein
MNNNTQESPLPQARKGEIWQVAADIFRSTTKFSGVPDAKDEARLVAQLGPVSPDDLAYFRDRFDREYWMQEVIWNERSQGDYA